MPMKYFKMFLKKLLRYVLKPLSFLPALMMMFVIFNFSAQDGTASSSVSSTVSVRFVQVCDRVLDRGWSDAQIAHYAERIEHYVRKLAHVTEYFLLAVAVGERPFSGRFPWMEGRRKRNGRTMGRIPSGKDGITGNLSRTGANGGRSPHTPIVIQASFLS